MPGTNPNEQPRRFDLPAARGTSLWARPLLRLARRLKYGRLLLVLPDGSSHTIDGEKPSPLRAVLEISRPRAVRRLLFGGINGFAEAYMDGDWHTPDLVALLHLALANEDALGDGVEGLAVMRWLAHLRHRLRPNTRRGSRRNIAYHYDLGNDFYAAWLDPSLTYSSALFDRPGLSLEAAQARKYRRLARALELRPGHRVLEIGCGWGGFALCVARDVGCHVTAITVSEAQARLATKRVHEAGLDGLIDIRLTDYRDVRGRFDRIASIEMFEAVGEANWPTYFDVVRDRLRPDGIAGLQVITIEDWRFPAYRRNADFIQTHIFPGGMLPSPSAMTAAAERVGLRPAGATRFGRDYATTLAMWQDRFQQAWQDVRACGFDLRFKRLWEFYLAYCEAGFRHGSIDVGQYLFRRA
ncbi:MAG: class I SAM-dependent methyltransferase [Rhodospirillales bacterium]|nr:MAG: class I SAM-dependent methyltransferase [Rhodospirillales bacterium]